MQRIIFLLCIYGQLKVGSYYEEVCLMLVSFILLMCVCVWLIYVCRDLVTVCYFICPFRRSGCTVLPLQLHGRLYSYKQNAHRMLCLCPTLLRTIKMTDCLYVPAGFSLFGPTAEVLAWDINASCTGTLFCWLAQVLTLFYDIGS